MTWRHLDMALCLIALAGAFLLMGWGVYWLYLEHYSLSAALTAQSIYWLICSFRVATNLGWK